MSAILHAWFDCDGTLYKQPAELLQLTDSAICKGISDRTGKSLEEITCDYGRMRSSNLTKIQIITKYGFSKEEAYGLYDSVLPEKFVQEDPRLREEIICFLKQDIPVSIFTNSRRSKLYGILDKLGLNLDWFTYLLTGEEVPAKPDIEGYLRIIERSRCSPGAILFTGDNENADTLPARNVGMNTLLIGQEPSVMFDDANKTHHFRRKTVYDASSVIREIDGLRSNCA
jgi:HAD superfamily hydrolase (TIGR01509 family)